MPPENLLNHNPRLIEQIIDVIPSATIIFKNDIFVTCNQLFLDYIDSDEIRTILEPGLTLRQYVEALYDHPDNSKTEDEYFDELHVTDKEKWIEERIKTYHVSASYDHKDRQGWIRIVDHYYDDGTYVGLRIDIEELKAAQEEAAKSAQMKSDFLASMSHEIRNPMNGIIGMAQILKCTELTPKQSNAVDVILRAGNVLVAVVNDILDFSKIEAGKYEFEERLFSLRTKLEDIVSLSLPTLEGKDVEIILDFPKAETKALLGDPDRLSQILMNLISNAAKFTEVGYIHIQVDFEEHDNHSDIVIKVIDTGIGMAAEKLETIFDSYAQATAATKRKYGGTGLGLTIGRKLVEAMGGTLSVSSIPNVGSTFTIELSFTNRPDEDGDIISNPVSYMAHNSRVLIVDDLAQSRKLITNYVKQFGFEVMSVDNAKDALIQIGSSHQEGKPFTMVVIDQQMPDWGGVELTRVIRNHRVLDDLDIIVLESMNETNLFPSLEAIRNCDVISKPVFRDGIYKVLAKKLTVEPSIHSQNFQRAHKEENHILPYQPRILLAEDNDDNRDIVLAMLQDRAQIDCVVNGLEAIEKFQLNNYDIVLMDINMPVMKGTEAAIKIREYERSIGAQKTPIIAVTANVITEQIESYAKSGIDDVLPKPIFMNELLKMVQLWTQAQLDISMETMPQREQVA